MGEVIPRNCVMIQCILEKDACSAPCQLRRCEILVVTCLDNAAQHVSVLRIGQLTQFSVALNLSNPPEKQCACMWHVITDWWLCYPGPKPLLHVCAMLVFNSQHGPCVVRSLLPFVPPYVFFANSRLISVLHLDWCGFGNKFCVEHEVTGIANSELQYAVSTSGCMVEHNLFHKGHHELFPASVNYPARAVDEVTAGVIQRQRGHSVTCAINSR